MNRTTIILMAITVLSKLLGLVREKVLGFFFGVSRISDAYVITNTITVTVFALIGTAIVTGYIPMFNKIMAKTGEKTADIFTDKLLTLFTMVCAVLSAIIAIFAEPVVLFFAKGFSGEILDLTVLLVRISIISIIFSLFTSVFSSYLNIKGSYVIPMLTGFPLNICYIASFFLAKKYSLLHLAIGNIAAYLSQAIFLYIFVIKKRPHIIPNFSLKDENLKMLIVIALPAIIGISVNKVNVIVDKTLASDIAGGVSALNYADKINLLVQGVFTTPLVTLFYPKFSLLFNQKNHKAMQNVLKSFMTQVILLLLPSTLAVMAFSEDIISIIFRGGKFQDNAVNLTSGALFFYGAGFLFFALRELLSKAFYALEDTKTPMINGACGVFLNIGLNLLLVKSMGINGLAFATSVTSFATGGALVLLFWKKTGILGLRGCLKDIIKISAMSVMAVGAAYLTDIFFKARGFSVLISFVPAAAVGAAIYLGFMMYFGYFNFKKRIRA